MSFRFLLSMVFFWVGFFPERANAIGFEKAGFQITAEPVVGYEWTQVSTHVWHSRGLLIYGARFVV